MGISCSGRYYIFHCRFDMDVLEKRLDGVIIDQDYSVRSVWQMMESRDEWSS